MTLRGRFARARATGPETEGSNRPPKPKGGTTGKMRRAKPPNVIGRGPLLASPGLRVAIVCIVKDEVDYLEEWLAFHFALGVSHVFIYDNGSTDGSARLLERYQNHGLVTVVDWPLGGGQLAAYNHALRFFGSSAQWLAYFDVDEFLVPLLDDDIPTFLVRFGEAADVRVERKEFGFSGHRSAPEGLTIDAYTETANVLALRTDLPPRVKSIVQPSAISAVDIHLAFPADDPPDGVATDTVEVEARGIAQLNHYYTRSFEEFEAKRFRGSATGRIDRAAVPFDIPTIATDTAAQRFSDRTRSMIDRLRSLDPQPYYYGSQLALSFFPRPNDLGRFAEFALANTAAGLEDPQRTASASIRNLYEGVGIIGDLAATGFVPTPGALARSTHTAVLVEHMRGRIERDVDAAPAADAYRATIGRMELSASVAAELFTEDGRATVSIELDPAEQRRCYALGFVIGASEPVGMEIDCQRIDGSSGAAVSIELPASPCVAGIVEIEPTPHRQASVRLDVTSTAAAIRIYDLFLISYG